MVEDAVVGEIRRMIRAPEIAARTIDVFRQDDRAIDEQEIVAALGDFDRLWASLFPAEQARIVHLLVERVTVGTNGIAIDLRSDGFGPIVRDMITPRHERARA
jgi:site-specific DNA recombinase